MRYDFIVVGSGVSGGRMAGNLVQAGAKVLLIEAGLQFNSKTFPKNELEMGSKMVWGGGAEMSKDGRIGFVRGKCLGGTSVINQALLDPFNETVFDDWSERSGVKFFNTQSFEPYYEKVKASMSVESIPEFQQNGNAKIFTRALDAMEYYWKPVQRAQSNCAIEEGNDCIVCLSGCPRKSKQSSLVTSIEPAMNQGLEIKSNLEVICVNEHDHHVELSAVQDGALHQFQASNVVLAGGAIGNSKILLGSKLRKKLPAIGKLFTCHPQFMSFGLFDEVVDAHKGAFSSVATDDAKLQRMGIKLENVAAGPIYTALLMPGFGSDHLNLMKKYRHYSSIEICVKDDPYGVISLDRNSQIVIDKPLSSQDRDRIKNGLYFVKELFETVGAKKIIQSHQGFGLHLMGGCSIGTNPKKSVVSPEFKLHDHKRIYISDSSIFPTSPGINPSFTIMALTEMAFDQIKKEVLR